MDNLIGNIEEIINLAENLTDEESKKEISLKVSKIAEQTDGELSIYLYSVAIYIYGTSDLLKEMLDCAYKYRDILGPNNVYTVYQQAISLSFRFYKMDDDEVLMKMNRLYKWCLEQYTTLLQDELERLQPSQQNKKMVIVLSNQVIEYLHGPTKVALDRCKILMDNGYKVLLINTAELLGNACTMKYYNRVMANYVDEYLEKDHLDWKGVSIPFFQCENNMPNVQTIQQLIGAIKSIKPYFAISMASGSIFEGVLSRMIPVFSVPMTNSELVVSGADYQACSPYKNDRYYRQLKILGLDEEQTIETTFSFTLMEQKSTRTRSELGIPEDAFILTTVSARLDAELDVSFWNMFRRIVSMIPQVKLMLIGDYEMPDSIADLKDFILPMGYVEDLLSYYDLCDLYVNPHRKGGGTSAVEAMSKGIPVVTDSFGDIASNVGSDFWTENYDGYVEIIKRYYEDKLFYKEMSELARKRAQTLLDADEEFMKAVDMFIKRFSAKS